jgi:molybdopterin-biosynthesis enzyme MoeA-like protein
MRAQYDYLFTTGGIGPTHDDMTIESVAKAFGLPLELHEEARRNMEEVHGVAMNEGRRRMLSLPRGARIFPSDMAVAPGFQIGNVFVMAGIPRVMQAMLESVKGHLEGSTPYHSLTVTAHISESKLSGPLRAIQERFPDVRIGSYPFQIDGKFGADIVIRSREDDRLAVVADAVREALATLS